MGIAESILDGRRMHLLPEKTLDEIIKHAKMVKDAYPKYDNTKREDVISYCIERLSGQLMYFGASPDTHISTNEMDLFRRKAHFFGAVIGFLVDNDMERESDNSLYSLFYTNLRRIEGGTNQVDIFLEEIGYKDRS